MIERHTGIKRQICGAATRFLAWRAGHHLQAIDPRAVKELARDAQAFAQLMRRLHGRQHRMHRGGNAGFAA